MIVGSMALSEKRTEDCDLDIHRFNECVFYIRGYGPPSAIVSFFVRHNCWTDACKYILDHVSSEGEGRCKRCLVLSQCNFRIQITHTHTHTLSLSLSSTAIPTYLWSTCGCQH